MCHVGNDILDLMKCDFGYYYLIVFVRSLFLFTHRPPFVFFFYDFVPRSGRNNCLILSIITSLAHSFLSNLSFFPHLAHPLGHCCVYVLSQPLIQLPVDESRGREHSCQGFPRICCHLCILSGLSTQY